MYIFIYIQTTIEKANTNYAIVRIYYTNYFIDSVWKVLWVIVSNNLDSCLSLLTASIIARNTEQERFHFFHLSFGLLLFRPLLILFSESDLLRFRYFLLRYFELFFSFTSVIIL